MKKSHFGPTPPVCILFFFFLFIQIVLFSDNNVMNKHASLTKELCDCKTELHDANKYMNNQKKLYKDLDHSVASSVASKSNWVMRLVDLPWNSDDWPMSVHSTHLLDSHRTLCRMMMNLETFSYDKFRDGIKDFLSNLEDYFSDNVASKCGSTGYLKDVCKWPHDNSRCLRVIENNITAKGGPKAVSLRDYLESYVSFLFHFRTIAYPCLLDVFDYLYHRATTFTTRLG